jgi:hypothetical protein
MLISARTEHILAWEANSRSPSEEFSSVLWNTKFHYRVHCSQPRNTNLSQMNPIFLQHVSFETHRNNFLPSVPRSTNLPDGLILVIFTNVSDRNEFPVKAACCGKETPVSTT